MDVMIFKNIFAEKIGVFAQNKAKLSKNWIITLAEKSQKIMIITSTPGARTEDGNDVFFKEKIAQ
jgi:uracil-DNA glycosylase